MSPKEWLAANCPLRSDPDHKCVNPNQRGRMSKEHHEILATANLDSYKPDVKENKDGSQRIVNAAAPVSTEKVVADLAWRYDEKSFTAVEIVSGKHRSMREACSNSGLSLVGCFCGDEHRIVAVGDRSATSVLVKVVPV